MMQRRSFLAAMLAAATAPAFIKDGIAREVLMPGRQIIAPPTEVLIADPTVSINDYLMQGEIGHYEGVRIITSPRTDLGPQRLHAPKSRDLTKATIASVVAAMQARNIPEVQGAYWVHLHSNWEADLRANGIPFQRRP